MCISEAPLLIASEMIEFKNLMVTVDEKTIIYNFNLSV